MRCGLSAQWGGLKTFKTIQLQGLQRAAQSSAGGQPLLVYPSGQYWVKHWRLTTSLMTWMMWQSALSVYLLWYKPGGTAITWADHVAIQGDLDTLKKWDDSNSMKFNKVKCKVCTWWGITPCTSTDWEPTISEQLCGRMTRVLIDTKLIMSKQYPLPTEISSRTWDCIRKSVSLHSGTGGATPGVWPVLGCPVEERHGHIKLRPVKGHRKGEGTEAYKNMQRLLGLFTLQKTQGDHIYVYNTWWDIWRRWRQTHLCSVTGWEAMDTNWNAVNTV